MVKVRRAKPKEKKEAKPKPKLSTFLNKKAEGRQNQFVFKGFYERLGMISAKLGHTNEKRYGYMREDEATRYLMGFSNYDNDDEDQVLLTSNFISMLNCSTKLNASLEFKKLHFDLMQYTSSYNLVILKKDEIIDKLINSIEFENGKVKDSNLAMSVIDLLIAIIKDMRTEISFETVFIDKIFPRIIQMIDILNVELLEQIILRHSNKFIKKFAAESFSYVLRKAKLEQLPKMINEVVLSPLVKPYKYLPLLAKRTSNELLNSDVEMKDNEDEENDQDQRENEDNSELDETPKVPENNNEQNHSSNVMYPISNVLTNQPFCQFEKFINNCIHNRTFSRTVGNQEFSYDFSYDEKLELIAILSMIFTEAIYGVQKRLYTEWMPFCDILLGMISTEDEELLPWYTNIFRFTMINLFSKLNSDSIHDLTKYITDKIGEECLNSLNNIQNTNKLECCILIIRDMFVYKEGSKLSPINTMTNLEFLYKILKNQAKSDTKLPERCLNLLVESLYLGYFNKSEQFINIFDLNHSSKLIDLINGLGVNYSLHFFSLASFKEINQRFYDLSRYNVMLLDKKAAVLPAYYTINEGPKMTLIFKPLAKILFSLNDEKHEYLIPFLSIFITIKNKIKESDLLELPKKFIHRIEKEIKNFELLITSEKAELNNKQVEDLWILTKIISMSKCSIAFDSILDHIESKVCEHKKTQRNLLIHKNKISDENIATNIDYFIPNIRPVLNLIKIKSNLLCIKYRNALTVGSRSIFSYSIDPSEQYFKTLLNCIMNSNEKQDLIQKHTEFFDNLSRFIMCARSPVRSTVVEILKIVLNNTKKNSAILSYKSNISENLPISLSESDLFNPCVVIDLMSSISKCEPSLETEKPIINNLHRLQNIFRENNVPQYFQVIYCRFLISQFWYRFTLIYETVHSSIGELLEFYHDSIITEFENLLDSIDTLLLIPPKDNKFKGSKDKETQEEQEINSSIASFYLSSVRVKEETEMIDSKFTSPIKMFELIMKSYGVAIPKLPSDIQKLLSKRFLNFMEKEFLIYHQEFVKIKGTKVKRCEDENDLIDNMIKANSIETKNYTQMFRKNSTTKLVSYISILQDPSEIKNILLILVSIHDSAVQQLVLKLLFKLNLPEIKPYEKSLLVFNSDIDFKDEIVKFSLSEDHVKKEHRRVLIPLLIRILNTKLTKKKGKAANKSLDDKRTIVYRFLSSLTPEEIRMFISQSIESFNISIEDTKDANIVESKLSHCSFSHYLGFLYSFKSICKHMGALLNDGDCLFAMCSVVTSIFKLSKLFQNTSKQNNKDMVDHEEDIDDQYESDNEMIFKSSTIKECQNTLTSCFKIINEIYEKYFYVKFIQEDFSFNIIKIMDQNIENLSLHNITSRSFLMQTFLTWSKHIDLHKLFLEDMQNSSSKSSVIDELCKIISIKKDIVNHEVIIDIFTIFKHIVIASTGNQEIDRRDNIIRMFMDNEADDEGEENEIAELSQKQNVASQNIIKSKLGTLIGSISSFLQFNWDTIKNGVLKKKSESKENIKLNRAKLQNTNERSQTLRSQGFIKDIVFILSELSVHVNLDQKDYLEQLTDMFIPLLTVKGFLTNGNEELISFTIKTVERLCQKMPSVITIKRYYQVSRLLSENIGLKTRALICNLLSLIPNEKIQNLTPYITDMNKVKKGLAIVHLDFDKAINSLSKFADQRLESASFEESVAILFQLIYFIAHSELALRSAAVIVMEKFLLKYKRDIEEYSTSEMKPDAKDIIERSNFINFHLLPSIKFYLNTVIEELQLKGCLKVLRMYILCAGDLNENENTKKFCTELSIPDEFIDMKCVINQQDENIDFFENILNIKLQRRYKAIRQLVAKIDSKEINSIKTMTKLILPFADLFVIRMSEVAKTTRGVISYTKQNIEQINNECYILYTKVCEKLPWSIYNNIIRKNIMKVTGLNLRNGKKLSKTSEKNMTKLICAIVSGFNFDIPDVMNELENTIESRKKISSLQEILNKILLKPKKVNTQQKGEDDDEDDEKEEISPENVEELIEQLENEDEEEPPKSESIEVNKGLIKGKILKSFVPSLFKHLKEKVKTSETQDDVKIRVHVAVAIITLLRKTSQHKFTEGYCKIIRNIVCCLRSKITKIRDKARDALVKVHLNVSPYMLHYTVDELQAILNKGFQRHVRSFTLHHLIESLVENQHLKTGQIDHCLHKIKKERGKWSRRDDRAIISILMDELFGKLGMEKVSERVFNTVKLKETRSRRATQTYGLLAQYIDFESSFIALIMPILKIAEISKEQSYINKCEELLSIISTSVLKNTSVTTESLLVVLYAIMKKGTSEEERLKEENQIFEDKEYVRKTKLQLEYETYKVLPTWKKELVKLKKTTNEVSRNLLVVFSLSTLKKAMGLLPIENYKDNLDSFCKLYIHLMRSSDNRVVLNTLHVLGKSIRLSLPSIKFYCRKIINNLFILFTTTSDNEFLNSLFKCTSEMVRYMKSELSEFHITKLVEIIKANLEHYQIQANVYGCLKTIIENKIISPHIYDLVDIVADKLITSANNGIRATCSQIFISFLIEYPLEEKRVEQHIHHLIKNLIYPHKDGRISIIEVIEKLITLFPIEVLDKYAFIIFLSLILRTVNDNDKDCKQKANTTLKLLLEHVSSSKRDNIIKTVLSWDYNIQPEFDDSLQDEFKATSHASMMKRVTFLLIGLIISIEGEYFAGKYFQRTYEVCSAEVEQQAEKLRTLYTVNVETQERLKEEEDQIDGVVKEMSGFLKEISLISEKDIQGTFKRKKITEEVSKEECLTLSATLIIVEKMISDKPCCKLLYDKYISKEEGSQFMNNLLDLLDHYFVSNQMCRLFENLFEKLEEFEFSYKSNPIIQKIIDEISLRIPRRFEFVENNTDQGDKLTKILMFTSLNLIERNNDNSSEKLQRMFDKCSFIGRKVMINLNQNQDKLITILKFYICAITAITDVEVLKCITKQIILLVYRTYTNPKLNNTEVKNLSIEIIELLQKKYGKEINDFLTIFSEVKKVIEELKQERKKNERVSAIKNVASFKRKRERKHKRNKDKERERNLFRSFANS